MQRSVLLRMLLLLLAALTLASGAALSAPVPWDTGYAPVPALALLLAFAGTELWVLHLTVGKQTRTISLSEVPLLLGLVFVDPLTLVVTRVLGPVLVHLVRRRAATFKTLFNMAISATEALAALAVLHLLLGADPYDTSGPWLWVAGYAATTVTALASHVVVMRGIALVESVPVGLRQLARTALVPVLTSATVTTLALVAVHSLRDDSRSSLLLLAVAGIVLLGYRGYAELLERHTALERLHAFSRSVSVTRHPDEVLRSVLEQARELLQSEYAAVHLDGPEGHRLVVELDRDGLLQRRPLAWQDDREGVLSGVQRLQRSILVARDDREPRLVRHLRHTGRRDLVLAPLPGASGAVGVLVAGDRNPSTARGFVKDDMRLLETVAHHAGAALQSGQLLERLQHDASHDTLTGLANRAALLAAAGEALTEGCQVAVVLLDLDGFKQVNDGLGHAAGDALLRATADRLTSVLPDQALAARLSGDEFAVLLLDAVDEASALAVARSVRIALSAPLTVHGVTLSIAASAGLAMWSEATAALVGGTSGQADTLLQHADLALSEARAEADMDVRVFTAVPGLVGPERLQLAADLRQALATDGLHVHVQPKARLRDRSVVGVEALVRWNHPHLGNIPPDTFVPLAERSGLIVPLTSFVLRTSIQAAADWCAAGERVHIAVNLSPRSLVDEAIVDEVLGLLEIYALPAELLTLEVTEGSVIAEPERAERILRRLREAGVRLSLDDFGTGYSSLTHLKRLPVHEVKIDRSFVRDMAHDDDDAAIVRSIVDLGLNLRLDVVAEGVEDDDSWNLLADLGCDLAQGYHLSRPMPLPTFPDWLRAHRTQVLAGHVAPATVAALPAPRAEAFPVRDAEVAS